MVIKFLGGVCMVQNKIDIGNWVEFFHNNARQILLGFDLTIGKFEVKGIKYLLSL